MSESPATPPPAAWGGASVVVLSVSLVVALHSISSLFEDLRSEEAGEMLGRIMLQAAPFALVRFVSVHFLCNRWKRPRLSKLVCFRLLLLAAFYAYQDSLEALCIGSPFLACFSRFFSPFVFVFPVFLI